ncbi:MAG: hypothetical protein K2Z81_01180, partial [Cyanobacteria bacterium]|nr:hypothetical protein [Cyanobacteriota bacterium]
YPNYLEGLKMQAAIKARLGKTKEFDDVIATIHLQDDQFTEDDARKIRADWEAHLTFDCLARRLRSVNYSDTLSYMEREQKYYVDKAEKARSQHDKVEALLSAAELSMVRGNNRTASELFAQAKRNGGDTARMFDIESRLLSARGETELAKKARAEARLLTKNRFLSNSSSR